MYHLLIAHSSCSFRPRLFVNWCDSPFLSSCLFLLLLIVAASTKRRRDESWWKHIFQINDDIVIDSSLLKGSAHPKLQNKLKGGISLVESAVIQMITVQSEVFVKCWEHHKQNVFHLHCAEMEAEISDFSKLGQLKFTP